MEQTGVHLDVTHQRQAQGSGLAFPHWLTVKRAGVWGGMEEEEVKKFFDLLLTAKTIVKKQ